VGPCRSLKPAIIYQLVDDLGNQGSPIILSGFPLRDGILDYQASPVSRSCFGGIFGDSRHITLSSLLHFTSLTFLGVLRQVHYIGQLGACYVFFFSHTF